MNTPLKTTEKKAVRADLTHIPDTESPQQRKSGRLQIRRRSIERAAHITGTLLSIPMIDGLIQFVQNSASNAPVAQLDRVPGYEPGGREFESLRAHH